MPAPVSMTGFAGASFATPLGQAAIEIRSVNSRFLDLTLKVADDLRAFEPQIRERIGARLARGKVECRLSVQRAAGETTRLNPAALAALHRLGDAVRQALPQAAPLSVAEVLRWPGVLGDDTLATEQLQAAAQELFAGLLGEFVASREREGAKLAAVLADRAARMRERIAAAEPLLPAALAAYRERLAAKLREAVANLDEDRIRQEVGVFAAKIDVAEEIARLITHMDELDRVLKKGGAVGKRLDFLMQELNREANTLSSKSVSAEVTAIALDLKLLIEQMREQVQNLE